MSGTSVTECISKYKGTAWKNTGVNYTSDRGISLGGYGSYSSNAQVVPSGSQTWSGTGSGPVQALRLCEAAGVTVDDPDRTLVRQPASSVAGGLAARTGRTFVRESLSNGFIDELS